MPAQLVYRRNSDKTLARDENNKLIARMIYRTREGQLAPWHEMGKAKDVWTIEEAKEFLQTSSKIHLLPVYAVGQIEEDGCVQDINLEVPETQAVCWEDEIIGKVGHDTTILQNDDFFNSFKTWEEAGFPIETAGYLDGGRKVWCQVNIHSGLGDTSAFDVRSNDKVLPYFFFAHGHCGNLSLTGSLNMTRVVCSNTLGMALNESAGSSIKRKHRGNVIMKASEIHKAVQVALMDALSRINQFKFLDSVKVTGGTLGVSTAEEVVYKFVNALAAKTEKAQKQIIAAPLSEDFKATKLHEDIATRFSSGIGNLGMSFWDLFNSVTERHMHGIGNSLTGESDSDRVGRRLDSAWFGTGSLEIQRAFSVAMAMAKEV